MERMIDGDKLVENLRLIATCWSISPFVSKEKHNGAVNMLREVEREVKEAPTLTPPNEPLTLELVAEILAEQFGDECACNFNGNDEWLPMMCHYGDVCPDPPEHLGCWMELLRNKYCRPPEGEEDT